MQPELYGVDEWVPNLVSLIIDLTAAYYRWALHPETAGMIATKLLGQWIINLSLIFGKRRAGEVYPLLTAAIVELHKLARSHAISDGAATFFAIGHVDDYDCMEFDTGSRLLHWNRNIGWFFGEWGVSKFSAENKKHG